MIGLEEFITMETQRGCYDQSHSSEMRLACVKLEFTIRNGMYMDRYPNTLTYIKGVRPFTKALSYFILFYGTSVCINC